MDFVDFNLAKKLKEKGFSCEIPFAMYNEIARFHLLTTAAPYNVCASGYKCREYYNYEDFDERDYIAPTISQVLKWLRDNKILIIPVPSYFNAKGICISWDVIFGPDDNYECCRVDKKTYEEAALAGVNYCLDNLI